MFPKSLAAVNSVVMLHAHAPLQIVDDRQPRRRYPPRRPFSYRHPGEAGVGHLGAGDSKHDEIAPNAKSLYYPAAYHTALIDIPIDAVLAPCRWMAVFVYGSMARAGGGRRDSDVDLLIVGRFPHAEAQRKLQLDLVDLGMKGYGRRFDALMVSPEAARAGLESNNPYLVHAIKEGVLIRGEWI